MQSLSFCFYNKFKITSFFFFKVIVYDTPIITQHKLTDVPIEDIKINITMNSSQWGGCFEKCSNRTAAGIYKSRAMGNMPVEAERSYRMLKKYPLKS